MSRQHDFTTIYALGCQILQDELSNFHKIDKCLKKPPAIALDLQSLIGAKKVEGVTT